jgi:hypothetical protein
VPPPPPGSLLCQASRLKLLHSNRAKAADADAHYREAADW